MIKYSVLVAPQVRDDVQQAKRWYKEKSPALPKRFDDEPSSQYVSHVPKQRANF